jgi:hypothetical protein
MLFKAALYNDTDSNGVMDISFNESADGYVYPLSTEAVCMLDFVNASGVVFGTPQIDTINEEISWNATLQNPYIRLTPYGQSPETGVLIDAPIVPVGDSSFGFTFAPDARQSGTHVDLTGVMKIDQTLGAINGSSGLEGLYKGLDLSIIYLSDVFEISAQQKVSAELPQNNASAKGGGGQSIASTVNTTTTETESLDFFIGSTRVSGLGLASENYSIGAEDPTTPTHIAKGAVIPYALYQYSMDQTGAAVSQRGSVDWNLSAGVEYSTYFYEVCYSDYNGSKITHDPSYTLYGFADYPAPIPGFEVFYIIFGISIVGCIVLFLKKREVSIRI